MQNETGEGLPPRPAAHAAPAAWSVVIPYFNEEAYIARTLMSLAAQDIGGLRLILVDNASTDNSEGICRALMAQHPGIDVVYLSDPRPGKTNALETGLAAVTTEFVSFCDADTFYPPQYLRRCRALFDGDANAHAVLALDLFADAETFGSRLRRRVTTDVLARLLRRQAHSGGSALSFRTAALRHAGGFSGRLWPFVLEDHEVIHRICRFGNVRYHYEHWCRQSARRHARTGVSWTRFERTLYSFTPYVLKDWLFYSFLAKRFRQRGLFQVNLRDKSAFQALEGELTLRTTPA